MRYQESAPVTRVASGCGGDEQGVSRLRTGVPNVEGSATPSHRAAAGRGVRACVSPPRAGDGASKYTSLRHFLEEHTKEQFPLSRKAVVLHQVALGLAYLHNQKYIHRDLSTNNILLDTETWKAKITDFGVTRVLDTTRSRMTGSLVPGVFVCSYTRMDMHVCSYGMSAYNEQGVDVSGCAYFCCSQFSTSPLVHTCNEEAESTFLRLEVLTD